VPSKLSVISEAWFCYFNKLSCNLKTKLSSTPEFLIVEIVCFGTPLVGELLRFVTCFEFELFLLESFLILLKINYEFLTLVAPAELSLVELTWRFLIDAGCTVTEGTAVD
jgi:hypothetical protein